MSVTDDFRAELDKHDVTWANVTPTITGFVVDGKAYRAYEYDGMGDMDGLQLLSATPLTPQEVIAATLGAGTCHNVHEPPKGETFWPAPHFKCSECGATHVSMEYVFYCPNCGRKVVDE